MGRLFLLNFSEGQTNYYMCRCCRTHIALQEDFHQLHYEEQGRNGPLFNEAINLQVDEPVRHRKVGDNTAAEVFCVKCGEKLGWKYIEVSLGELVVRKGMVKLILRKLVKRIGNLIILNAD